LITQKIRRTRRLLPVLLVLIFPFFFPIFFFFVFRWIPVVDHVSSAPIVRDDFSTYLKPIYIPSIEPLGSSGFGI
jgi:hypothetical protein